MTSITIRCDCGNSISAMVNSRMKSVQCEKCKAFYSFFKGVPATKIVEPVKHKYHSAVVSDGS